jgi:hypothetical protein
MQSAAPMRIRPATRNSKSKYHPSLRTEATLQELPSLSYPPTTAAKATKTIAQQASLNRSTSTCPRVEHLAGLPLRKAPLTPEHHCKPLHGCVGLPASWMSRAATTPSYQAPMCLIAEQAPADLRRALLRSWQHRMPCHARNERAARLLTLRCSSRWQSTPTYQTILNCSNRHTSRPCHETHPIPLREYASAMGHLPPPPAPTPIRSTPTCRRASPRCHY